MSLLTANFPLLQQNITALCVSFVVSQPFCLGSDKWTMQERRQLNKALDKHHKDFFLVQKMVSVPLRKQKSPHSIVNNYIIC